MSIVKICLISGMSLHLSLSQFLRSYKTVCPNKCKQQRKHPEPKTDAKHKARCLSTSEIMISYYIQLQGFIAPLIYNTMGVWGVKNYSKQHDVIDGRPLIRISYDWINFNHMKFQKSKSVIWYSRIRSNLSLTFFPS